MSYGMNVLHERTGSAMKRSAPMKRISVKGERCKHCKRPLGERERGIHPDCADGWYAANREKLAKKAAAKKAREAKAERVNDRAKKQSLKKLAEFIAEAQVAVNAYVRARDQDKPCICCGKPFEPNKPGGSMDAGHYLARSIAPQHRFDADRNIFGQRKNCNRPGGATRSDFRAGVIGRIGLAAVEALEADSSVTKWTREQLVEIKKVYRAKTRELVKARAA